MKKLIFSLMLSVLFLSTSTAQKGYDRTGYDGDFFSLEGAIDVFKKSNSIRDFERRLNTRDSWVNNLDLDFDGQTDYIRVEHKMRGDYHAIILQIPINRRELQDVAVIEIEKTGRRKAMLQIIGDEYLYGEQVIVEPYESYGYSNGKGGPNADFDYRRGYVNVYYWSAVRHILRRSYDPWISPYRYSYYPTWWSPWRPSPWDIYRPNIVVYNRYYQIVYVHRLRNVYNFYRPYRNYCPSVYQRSNRVRVNRTNRQLSPSYSKVRTKQRAQFAETNRTNATPRKGNNKLSGRTNATTGSQSQTINPSRSSSRTKATPSRSSSRASSSPSRSSSRTKATPSRSSSRASSTPSRSSSRTKATPSRSNSRASSSQSRSSNRTKATSSRSSSRASSSPSRSSSRAKATPSRSSSRASSSSNRSSSRTKATPSRSSSKASARSSNSKKSTPRTSSSRSRKN